MTLLPASPLLPHDVDDCPSITAAEAAGEGDVGDFMQLARPLLAAGVLDIARRRVPAEARDWFEGETATLGGAVEARRFVAAFVAAARHAGAFVRWASRGRCRRGRPTSSCAWPCC
jgi:hypothetical protein